MKKFCRAINILMIAIAISFLGYSVFICYNRIIDPQRYMYFSAPWYTGIMVYGVLAAGAIILCLAVKAVLKILIKKQKRRGRDI